MSRADLANKVYRIFLRDSKALDENDAELWQHRKEQTDESQAKN